MKTKQLTTDAVMAAMCAVLGYIAIDTGAFKLTFESLPILLVAFLYGPVDGMAVGFVGTFLYQLLRYGIDPSTPFWVLPYVLVGLLIGLIAKRYGYRNSKKQIVIFTILGEFLLFLLNSVGLYFYAGMIGKSGWPFVLGTIWMRFAVMIVKGIGFGLLMNILLRALHRFRFPSENMSRAKRG